MKKLLVFVLALCGGAAVLHAQDAVNWKDFSAELQKHAMKQLRVKNVVRVHLDSGVHGGSWQVSCSALVDNKATLTLDTPCTEVLALSFVNGSAVQMGVDLSKLGSYSSGQNKGNPFEYTGTPDPKNFRVLDNGLAIFQLPINTLEVKQALSNLPSLEGITDAETADLFRKSERPSSFYSGAPGRDDHRTYPAASVAGFKKFLVLLDNDLKNYASKLGGKVELRNYIDENTYDSVQGYALFINRNGYAVMAVAPGQGAYRDYDGLLAEAGGKANFFVDLGGMGKYSNGKGFFYNGNGTAVKNDKNTEIADRPTLVRLDLPKNGPVYNTLQYSTNFENHKILTLWLKDFAPRAERVARLMSK